MNRSHCQHEDLRKRRNTGLENTALSDPGFSCQGQIGDFIGYYLRCEAFAKKLQKFYLTDKNHKNHKKSDLNIDLLKKALVHFKLHFDEEKLSIIFKGGEGKRGNKSARQLRNGYLHQLSEGDRNEILNKSSDMIESMTNFLTLRICERNHF